MQTAVEGFRLSPQQRRLWSTDSRGWCGSQLVLSIDGELNSDHLRRAMERVCQRHEALRTTFRRLPGVAMPVQCVFEEMRPVWRMAEIDEPAALDKLLEHERCRAFDYEKGPLVYATLFVLDTEQHVLSVTLPALCADRRTLSNLFVELSGEPQHEPFQYLQFSEWQNSLAEDDDAAKGRDYWSRLDLSHLSTSMGEQKYATHSVKIEAQTTASVLLAVWQTLLQRVTQQPVTIGNVCAGRSYELLHDAFGLFARALPAPAANTENMRFMEVIVQLDTFQQESEEWQDYFDSEQRFSFGFEYAEHLRPARRDDLEISIVAQHCRFEPFALKLTCVAAGAALELTFEYDTGTYHEIYIHRLTEQFETLLTAALANPETLVDELDHVSTAERQQIVHDWNNTRRDYQLDHCIHELFEQQAARTPDALAVVFADQQLTFAELNRRANQLAHHLHAQGVGLETPVGICLEPSLEMIIAVLAVLKAGGAYVPFDPRNPQTRIEQLQRATGITILLTADQLPQVTNDNPTNPRSGVTAENLAYIIYTSGSTGQPKGVMVQHKSVANLAAALRDDVYAGFAGPLNVGLSAPLAFDASVKQLIQLLSGHTLQLLPEELRLDAPQALAYIERHALDVLDCTPAQLKLLLASGMNKNAKHTLKLMLVGGEALDESIWSSLAEDPCMPFFNVYGPTECTVDATWTRVTNERPPNIGRPIPNAQAYILDPRLKPAGVNVSGELYLGGAGLARGYLNAPERTAERFIPDSLSGQSGARLYRTGDLARYAADGSIAFIGRNDAQVKVRGFRIELGEIEAVLREHEQVQQAVVLAREDRKGDVRLVGYVVASGRTDLDLNELRRDLSERLPEYMLPSFLVPLDELPLTRNGKIDLAALPAPDAVRRSRDENYVAPRNEIEASITRVWQEALGVERIGVNDNFFDAGGHSLLMVQVHNKLSEMFEKQISIVEMFAKPTIGALAEYFSETNGHKPTFDKVMSRAARRRQAANVRQ